jgi:hypothetical protein
MKNNKIKNSVKKTKDRPWDMYQVKEHPLTQAKRIAGPRYEKDEHPLKQRMAYMAADSDVKAVKLIKAISAIGFTFNLIGKYDFEVVVA